MSIHQPISEPILRKYKTYWLIEYYNLNSKGERLYPAIRQTFDINREKDLTKREVLAESYINSIRSKFKLDRHGSSASKTNIIQALQEVSELMQCYTNKDKTRETIKSFCVKFERFLVKSKLDKLRTEDIDYNHICSFFDYLTICKNRDGEPLRRRTLNNYRGNGVWIFNKLLERKYIKTNYFLQHPKFKKSNKTTRNYEDNELEILFEYVEQHDPLLFFALMLIYRCAIRSKEELITLKPSCFDFKNQLIRIKGEISKTNEDDQYVTIPDDLVDYLKEFIKHIPQHYYIFGEGKGLKPSKRHCGRNALYNRFRKHLIELDEQGVIDAKGLIMYRLKHKGSQDLLKAGVNVLAISKHLRHKSIRTTEIYLETDVKINAAVKVAGIGPRIKIPPKSHE